MTRYALVLIVLGGCMRITPDPELPDVIVEWVGLCGDDGVTVRIVATSESGEVALAEHDCDEGEGRVEDVGRERHDVQVELLDEGGEVVARSYPEPVDLSRGFSVRTYVWDFLRDQGVFTATWEITGGETCASLGTSSVQFDFATAEGVFSGYGGYCPEGTLGYYASVQAGTYTVTARATNDTDYATVATAPPREGVVVGDRGQVTELGHFELVPCAPDCPETPTPPF
jgi:hypothetical protein